MISCWRIFLLEWKSLVRSRTLIALMALAVGWVLLSPAVFVGDGTLAGDREVVMRYALGGVMAMVTLALMATAAGSLARDRATRRLALTLVRPVRYPVVALARMAALTAAGALVLLAAGAVTLLREEGAFSRPCRHVLKPRLPSPRAEAEAVYREFLADPRTPPAVRKLPKATAIRILAQRALDHYQTLATNLPATLDFELPAGCVSPSVRLRFSNSFNMRDEVVADLALGPWAAAVSNVTQAVIELPLTADAAKPPAVGVTPLTLVNRGRRNLMLRPRRDVEVLYAADSFAANLLRTLLELTALIALTVALGVFLGAALSRPVALFVAVAVLVMGEVSPSIIDQYPDSLDTGRADRLALYLTRFAAEATHPLTAVDPVSALSRDECVEWRTLARTAAVDAVVLPLALSVLAALVMARKRE